MAGLFTCFLNACGESPTAPAGPSIEQQVAATIPFASLGSGLISFNRYEFQKDSQKVILSTYVLDVNARSVSIHRVFQDEETRISPDGQTFASLKSTRTNGVTDWDLYITDRSGGWKRVTTDGGDKNTPSWSWDGSKIYYVQTIGSQDVVMQLNVASRATVQFAKPIRASLQLRTFLESSKGVFLFASLDSAYALTNQVTLFFSPNAIFSIRADGTGVRQLTPRLPGPVRTPVWSPDGTTFAFGRYGTATVIEVANADGTNRREIVSMQGSNSSRNDYSICWTGDGSRILFNNYDTAGYLHLFSVRSDGSDLVQITSGLVTDANVSCSH